jgi:hypothetical protein
VLFLRTERYFYELFDLNADPDMLVNLYRTTHNATLKNELHENLMKVRLKWLISYSIMVNMLYYNGVTKRLISKWFSTFHPIKLFACRGSVDGADAATNKRVCD